jgi:putative ABC transport system permease protein
MNKHKLKANLREAIRSLYAFKHRSILTLTGIIIGIASVISMVSISIIVKEETIRQLKEMGSDILTIQKGTGGMGKERASKNIIRFEDVSAIPLYCPLVRAATPLINIFSGIKYKATKWSNPVIGTSQLTETLDKIKMRDGRFISDLDMGNLFCVIGSKTAHRLRQLGIKEIIGAKLKFADNIFTVIGVMEQKPMGMRPYDINDSIIIPASTALRIFDNSEITTIIAQMKPDADYIAASNEIKFFFAKKGVAVNITSAEELIARVNDSSRTFTLLLGAIGSISLIVGGIGVMNMMLISVSERRQEIGIRKAVGARRRDIQSQFLIEAGVLCLIGGFIGIIAGVSVTYAIARFSHWHFALSPIPILLGVGISSCVGVFFGFYPARRAAKLDPIIALRTE